METTQLAPAYSDEELKPFFDEVIKGYTYQDATINAGMDRSRIERNMNDLEFRIHVLHCSMLGTQSKTNSAALAA